MTQQIRYAFQLLNYFLYFWIVPILFDTITKGKKKKRHLWEIVLFLSFKAISGSFIHCYIAELLLHLNENYFYSSLQREVNMNSQSHCHCCPVLSAVVVSGYSKTWSCIHNFIRTAISLQYFPSHLLWLSLFLKTELLDFLSSSIDA